MRTISLRMFRAAVSDPESFDEPLSVVVRRGGELVTLGTWTPVNRREDPPVDMVNGRLIERYQAPARPFTPAPKPGKR